MPTAEHALGGTQAPVRPGFAVRLKGIDPALLITQGFSRVHQPMFIAEIIESAPQFSDTSRGYLFSVCDICLYHQRLTTLAVDRGL